MSGIVKSWLGIFNSYHYFKKSRCQVLSKAGGVYSLPTTISRRADVRYCQKLAGYIQFLPLFQEEQNVRYCQKPAWYILFLPLFQEEQMSGFVANWLGILNSYHYFKKNRCQVLSKAGWVYSIPTTISRRADVRFCQKLAGYIQFLPLFQDHYFKKNRCQVLSKAGWVYSIPTTISRRTDVRYCQKLAGYIQFLPLFQEEQMSGIVKSWLGIFNSYHYFKKSSCQVLSKAGWVYSIPTTILRRTDVR